MLGDVGTEYTFEQVLLLVFLVGYPSIRYIMLSPSFSSLDLITVLPPTYIICPLTVINRTVR